MSAYNFDKSEEYKAYKKIGKNSIKNYSEWKKKVQEKYNAISPNSLENFVKYLEEKKRRCLVIKSTLMTIIIPVVIGLFSAFIGYLAINENEAISFFSYSNETFISAQSIATQYQHPQEALLSLRNHYNEQYSSFKKTIDQNGKVFLFICVLLIVFGIVSIVAINHFRNFANFYDDYIEMIDNLLKCKYKTNSVMVVNNV